MKVTNATKQLKLPNLGTINVNLSGWPAAITIVVGVGFASGVTVYIVKKMVDNGYQIILPNGVNITNHFVPKETNNESQSGSEPAEKQGASASCFYPMCAA